MGGRGRGGPAKTSTFTQEQLQTLGVIGKDKDLTPCGSAPPPTFPPLSTRPVKLEITAPQAYKILWREGFLNHMQDSPYYLKAKQPVKRELNNYKIKLEEQIKEKANFNWELMPNELKVTKKRTANAADKTKTIEVNNKKKLKSSANIEDTFKKLEEKELVEDDAEVQTKLNSESEAEDEEEAPADDEMDDENDYGNSYFDNGEAYNEEDDNLDDDPVY